MTSTSNTRRQLGHSATAKRRADDFYSTPDVAIKALLVREQFNGTGWECASGSGAIAKYFPNIIASDIRRSDDVYGAKGIDFLHTDKHTDFIITNPPFKHALEFAKHACECADKVALFMRIQFLEGLKRYQFLTQHPPVRIYIFSDRINCDDNNNGIGGIMCFCWYIWEKGFNGKPTIEWIIARDGVS